MVGNSEKPLAPNGPQLPGSSIRIGCNRWCIEKSRQEVVGEVCVLDDSSIEDQFLHDGQSDTLHGPALDLTDHRLGVEDRSHILGGVDADYADQTELRIDVNHRPVSRNAEVHMQVPLAVLIRLFGLRMPETHQLLERAGRTELVQRRNETPIAPDPGSVQVVAVAPLQGSSPHRHRRRIHGSSGHLRLT